jgi:hypothetical protein
MRLDVTASQTLVVLKLPARGLEGVSQRDVWIFVGAIGDAFLADDDLAARYGEVYRHLEQPALSVMMVRRFDAESAVDNLRTEFLQPIHQLLDARFQSG